MEVIYPKGQFDSEYQVEMKLTIPSCKDVKQDLDTVFRYMNHVDGSDVERQLESFRCRSMCSGDIVEFADGEQWLCEFVGWKKVGEPR